MGEGFCAAVIFKSQILIYNFKENIELALASLFLGIPMIIYIAMRSDVAGKRFFKDVWIYSCCRNCNFHNWS